jgi:hypothetical protein
VRLREIAFIRQVSHYVADRSRTKRIRAVFGDGTRANWFTRLDIRAHDGMQDFLLPRIECSFAAHYKMNLSYNIDCMLLKSKGSIDRFRTRAACSLLE